VVTYEINFSAYWRSIVVDIKRAHEYPYQQFGFLDFFAKNVVDAGADSLLDDDDLLIGFKLFHVNYCPVSRTYNIVSGRGMPRRIPEKPDISPE
jgi:hypothetical protein